MPAPVANGNSACLFLQDLGYFSGVAVTTCKLNISILQLQITSTYVSRLLVCPQLL